MTAAHCPLQTHPGHAGAPRAHLGGAASFLAPTMPTFPKAVGREGPCTQNLPEAELGLSCPGRTEHSGPLVTRASPCLIARAPHHIMPP